MPLSKARDKERKRLEKARLESNLNIPENVQPNILSAEATRAVLERRKRERARLESSLFQPSVTPDVIPWYNSQVHKAGDRVRVNVRGRVQVLTVPSLDGDGHPMPV